MKQSKRQQAIEARRASDPIARKMERTDIDYANPDELPTAPRIIAADDPIRDIGKEPVKLPLPMYLECAMCGAPDSFVISPFDPAVGYCFKEREEFCIMKGPR